MRCLTPDSMEALARALAACSEKSCLLAGGTDAVIRLRKTGEEPDLLVYPGAVPELREIALTETSLRIGSMVTMARLADAAEMAGEFRAIADAAGGVGSPQIRNKATIGGNLCSASPAGDLLPVVWLYGAKIEILAADGALRRLSVEEFLLGPGKTALKCGEAVTAVVFPRTGERAVSAFRKIGSRQHVSIARESAAAWLALEKDGTVKEARLTLGAVSGTPIRVGAAEELLRGQMLTEEMQENLWPVVAEAVRSHCRPANRAYKTEAARGLTADLLAALAAQM